MNFLKEIKKSISISVSVIILGLLIFSILKFPINNIKVEKVSALTIDNSIIPSGSSGVLDLGSLGSTWRNLFLNGFDVQDGKVNSVNNFEGSNPGRGLMVVGGGFSDNTGNRFCYTTGNVGQRIGICEVHGLTCDSILQFENSGGSTTAEYFKPCNTYTGGDFYFMCLCK